MLLLQACAPATDYAAFDRPAPVPIPGLAYPAATAVPEPRRLLILLPPIGEGMAEFERRGWIAAVQQALPDLDVLAVDAHYGYYAQRRLLQRLHDDILQPARQHYRETWIAGVSLGGYGALLALRAHPDLVDGLILLSPYLGEPATVQAIRRQGWAAWRPQDGQEDDSLWSWLHAEAESQRIWLGYARHERFADAHALLAGLLPQERVLRINGLHAWQSWNRLWPRLLLALQT